MGLFLQVLILQLSFYVTGWVKYGFFPPDWLFIKVSVYYTGISILIALLLRNNQVQRKETLAETLGTMALVNIFILGFFFITGRFIFPFTVFRTQLTYAILISTALEFLVIFIRLGIRSLTKHPFYYEKEVLSPEALPLKQEEPAELPASARPETGAQDAGIPRGLRAMIIEETDYESYSLIVRYLTSLKHDALIVSTSNFFNVLNQPEDIYKAIVNLQRVNDCQYINKFFEAVNSKLEYSGTFIGWAETYTIRRKRILAKFPYGISHLVYLLDFIVTRIFPKLPVTKKIYFFITRGKNRAISKAETFGRLYSCGFELEHEQMINGRLFFVAKKVKEPSFDNHPTYGPIIKLKRMGKNGKIIGVYKFRTMHPYSEYLQKYVYDRNSLDEGGKFKDDFRISAAGRLFRKLWIDELPMFINLMKGELKIVGVRPLSQHYFSLYTEELKHKRLLYKPGLIPPFYADLPKTLEEIMDSERRYLDAYAKKPIRTDLRYFFKSMRNILFRHARSK